MHACYHHRCSELVAAGGSTQLKCGTSRKGPSSDQRCCSRQRQKTPHRCLQSLAILTGTSSNAEEAAAHSKQLCASGCHRKAYGTQADDAALQQCLREHMAKLNCMQSHRKSATTTTKKSNNLTQPHLCIRRRRSRHNDSIGSAAEQQIGFMSRLLPPTLRRPAAAPLRPSLLPLLTTHTENDEDDTTHE